MKNLRLSFLMLATVFLIACGGSSDDDGDDVADDGDDGMTPPTAARMNTMEVRDPHMFALNGAVDVTDTVNSTIADGITMDGSDPPDGRLDLSLVLVFRPWDSAAASGDMDVVAGANCTAAAPTMCSFDPAATVVAATATNGDSTCLTPVAGTTGGYDPPVTSPSGRCFATGQHTVSLTLGPVSLTLEDAQVAATYSGSGHELMNGLMTGFMSQAAADATILPADLPVVGGMPLSSLLEDTDRDMNGATAGWWFYINFTATEVPYSE
jgi:hypothetical protein